jgi:predicted nucleic acid-binding protein
VRYLLDVSALVAFGFQEHEFHPRMASWARKVASESEAELLSCSITELGFVRVLSQTPQYGGTVSDARALLLQLKANAAVKFVFVPDQHDISQLPLWVASPRQVTDGHLTRLAAAHNGVLATLDTKIPRAYLIPVTK